MTMTLKDKLTALKIPGEIVNITEDNFNVCYHVLFDPDITISKVNARIADLGLFFNTTITAEPAAGGCLVIKAEKKTREIVNTADMLNNINTSAFEIPLVIGMSEDGTPLYYDLVKCPHILAGGSTGSGKSVFINNLILSTFYNNNTELMLIDVKRVELSIYNNLPRLCYDIAYNAEDAKKALKVLCHEMDARYIVLQSSGCRNIQEYRKHNKMNYIACFIDELADLVLCDPEIETYLVRLAQLGRAAGIHLVVATQRPDASILSGLLRSNIPTRACFAVQKATDSRIILDMSGGEKLRGRGDGLFVPIGSKKPIRFQAPFIDTEDIKKLITKQIELSRPK